MANIQYKSIKLEKLLLDPNNPRLGLKKHFKENEYLDAQESTAKLLDGMNLISLRESIMTNGYIPVNNILTKKN